jgi:hypothetical protein
MGKRNWTTALLVIVLGTTAFYASSGPQPEYWPLCGSPQNIAPMQDIGGAGIHTRSDAVWNGKDYAVVWTSADDQRLHFRRFFADGTPQGAIATPSGLFADGYRAPRLVWNGSNYGVAWVAHSGLTYQTYFARLDANGALVGSEVKVSFVGMSETANTDAPSLAWSGSGYAVAWSDYRNDTDWNIFATLLNADGTIANSGASHDIILCDAADTQDSPSVAWSKGADYYRAVWIDYRSGTKMEIWGGVLRTDGSVTTDGSALISGSSDSYYPVLCDNGNGLGMVWYDYRNGSPEIYFARLYAGGNKIGTDVRLTYAGVGSYHPRILWTGAEYGVFWYDSRAGSPEIWFQRVSAAGVAAGDNTQVTVTSGMYSPVPAFGRYGYMVTAMGSSHKNFVQAWGCNYAYTPGCPSNLLAYGISGTTATISWQAALDNYTDIAYYAVYRNNTEIGKTSNNYYTDTGLGLNTTYNYTVRAVNAAQYMNDPQTCSATQPQSVYVKTSASFTLMLDKNDPNAHLYWNDGGLNSYNIFKGTSPQVMSLIGSTSGQSADDANVLLDTNNYFYTVDDPGE